MKKIKLLSSLFALPVILSVSAIPLASCSCGNSAVTINLTAAEGGTVSSSSFSVAKGTLWTDVDKPKAIANDGYVFDNWYINDQVVDRYMEVNSSAIVTAKFIKLNETSLTPKIMFCDYTNKTYVDSGVSIPGIISKFDNLPTGYTWLGNFYNESILPQYGYVESDYKATITNKFHTGRQATCVFDFKNQTMTFDNVEEFMDSDADSDGAMTEYCLAGGHKYFNSVRVNQYSIGGSYTIDLSKYNIRIVWYNNKGYIPFELINNVLAYPFQLGVGITWGNVDFNGTDIYQIPTNQHPDELTFKSIVKSASGDYYNAKYMEYVYDLLALTLDFRFGMTWRQSRAYPGVNIKYLSGGAYKVLKPYYKDMISLEANTGAEAFRKAMRENFDDGGHTAFAGLNALSTKTRGEIAGNELNYNWKVDAKLTAARTEAGHATPAGKLGYYEKYEYSGGNIGYITFDAFDKSSQDTWSADEVTAGRELPYPYTTDDNYGDDTLRLTMYANQKVKEDNIKNLVVDLSLNRGGLAYSEHFIASWLCGGVTQKIYNPKTNDYCEYTCLADINGDGKFDENDYLSKDIRLFVITSTKSFSCGNILPCNIRDNRPSTVFFGHNSGGGPCIVDTTLLSGANSTYQASSTHHLLRLASTPDKPITMDDGCGTPDWIIDELKEPEVYYNREEINSKILNWQ